MKNKLPIISVFFILAIILISCSAKPTPVPASPVPDAPSAIDAPSTTESATATPGPTTLSAILSEIAGKVEMKQSTATEFSPAMDKSFLDENGQAMTGNDGHLRLDLSTGTIVRLAPDSLFTLISNEPADGSLKTRLQLTIGKLFVILKGGSLEVDTPTGTAAVRGSYLGVDYDPDSGEVRITCLEGHCSLGGAGGTVEITAGQTAVIIGVGQPPQVGEMSDEDFQEWLDNNPEAKVIIEVLFPDAPPTETVLKPLFAPSPQSISKPTKESSEEDAATASPTTTPAPTLVPTVVISNVAPSSPVVGESIICNISVQPSAGGPIPTGTVRLLSSGNPICSATLDSAGNAACVGSISASGFPIVAAEYLGNSQYLPAQSASLVEFYVGPASTTTTLVSYSPSPSLVGSNVTFTATVDVQSPGLGTPYGTVTFTDGSANTCVDNAAPWECAINFPAPGQYSMQAIYSGDSNFSGSNSAFVTHNTLANSDTAFQTPSGPTGTLANCNSTYQVQALDVDGVSGVQVEYRIGDSIFVATDLKQALTWNASTSLWEGTFTIPALVSDTVYWRFIATDSSGNKFFLGNATTYSTGYTGAAVNAYSYTGLACP